MRSEYYRGPFTVPNGAKVLLVALLVLVPLVYAINSTLIFDDPGLYEHFSTSLNTVGLKRTLITLFFNRDLHEGYAEYRTYGVSKVLHFLLWRVAGTSTWIYSSIIGATQVLSAALLYSLLRKVRFDRLRALLLGLLWVASPFLVTTCFHHYSYLILPLQATIALTHFLAARLLNGPAPGASTYLVTAALAGTIALMGEAHIPLTIALALGIVAISNIGPRSKVALSAVVLVAVAIALYAHHLGWQPHQPVAGKDRFSLLSFGNDALAYRSVAFISSIGPGLIDQVKHILTFNKTTTIITLVYSIIVLLTLSKVSKSIDALSSTTRTEDEEEPDRIRLPALIATCIAIAGASFAVPWLLAVVVGPYGESLPRRYGYVPYTILLMIAVAILGAPQVRSKAAAISVTSAVIGLYLTLVTVCLPVVRQQDAAIWSLIREAVHSNHAGAIMFANAWNPSTVEGYVSGHDTPGLRGPNFPIIFESPLMSLWWQSLYARSKFAIETAGDGYRVAGPGSVEVTGMVRGVHFLPFAAPPINTSSVLVAFDPRIVRPSWKNGPAPVKMLTFQEFPGTSSSVARVEHGWVTQEFLSLDDTVIIDVGGAVTDVGTSSTLPDKHWDDAVSLKGPVLNYGIESGEDRIFRPEPMPRTFRGYYETNRHGDFVYRIDFTDQSPKVIAIDFLDFWSRRHNARVISLDIDLDDQLVTLGQVDVSTPSGNEPVTVMFRSGPAKTLRIRLRKALTDSDIPLISGIRVTRLKGPADQPIHLPTVKSEGRYASAN